MWDMLKSRDLIKEDGPCPRLSCPEHELRNQCMPALDVYRQAVRNPMPACLEALLEARCRSVWICRLAAQEGKPAFLSLAASQGCPCDVVTLGIAAKAGNPHTARTTVPSDRRELETETALATTPAENSARVS